MLTLHLGYSVFEIKFPCNSKLIVEFVTGNDIDCYSRKTKEKTKNPDKRS